MSSTSKDRLLSRVSFFSLGTLCSSKTDSWAERSQWLKLSLSVIQYPNASCF